MEYSVLTKLDLKECNLKLIIEKWGGDVYTYFENDKQFKKNESTRLTRLVPEKEFRLACKQDCALHAWEDFHTVITV